MGKNTVLAVVLSFILIVAGMMLQSYFLQKEALVIEEQALTEQLKEESKVKFSASGEGEERSTFTVESGPYSITFDTKGAAISSLKLTNLEQNREKIPPFELVYKEEGDDDLFTLYINDDKIDDVFSYTVSESEALGAKVVTFFREYEGESGEKFVIEKKFAIPESEENVIQIALRVYSDEGETPLSGSTYALLVGPQIGPVVERKNNYDYRRVELLYSDKSKKSQVKYKNGEFSTEDEVSWVSLSGKYFSYILASAEKGVIKEINVKQDTDGENIYQKNLIYVKADIGAEENFTDIYSFYAGPKVKKNLSLFNEAKDNIFKISEANFNKVLDASWLGWLQTILNVILQFFYRFVHNYGIAIILLTIFIKILLHPLTKKGTESTAKMSALSPKIEEIRKKYPDDPQAQNLAMSKLYKDEGISPMGSCIPMLIQFPIFIALYGLLNNSFDLRGSLFIPHWIEDLSIPDTVFTLPFNIPLLGSMVHLLPILYVISMIISMKISQAGQTPSSQQGMMTFMTYGLPIIFFFIMYNAPSGLLLYWSTVNVISTGQQIRVNRKKKAGFVKEIEEKDAATKAKKKRRR